MDQKKSFGDETKLRIAIVNQDKCKPKKCRQECKNGCPINKQGKLCIQVTPKDKIANIAETLCIGCNVCVKKCPFQAIKIINLPKDLSKDLTHRYGPNTFKLHRLPTPRPGQVLGLVGTNGIGKSTALKILAGKEQPNLGRFDNPPDWNELLKYFRGSELQGYFTNMLEQKLKSAIKIQYVDAIPKYVKGKVGDIIRQKDSKGNSEQLLQELQLDHLLERDITQLSGGELQRLAILIVCIQDVQISMFDEPSSYLDVKQRLKAARVIRQLIQDKNYIICVEHDLSVLDYLSDFICCLYGEQTAYGIVTMPFSVREGINIFLGGFIPTENMRFREYGLSFRVADNIEPIDTAQLASYTYPHMVKKQGDFQLTVHPGSFSQSEIIVLLGENGTGKTTFIKMLAGKDADMKDKVPELNVSYKPQTLAPKFDGSVRDLLNLRLSNAYTHPAFVSDVGKPMMLEDIIDNEVQALSGGELQRVALILALGKPADVYLIDEPSAYLDSEQRIIVAKVIKRFIMNTKRAAFIVEHDFIMATYLADKVIVYEGSPGKECIANSPQSLVSGMNKFLEIMSVTFRRDPSNFRPRINKMESLLDREQKLAGNYFSLEE
ncbi:hypothetical protein IMG5_009800 [Ichthyophthirius multifiliis]|uniref:Uncharacterized protein n=1 Tax=Ichthyophthirius multifiliis TaxID=5932 RepID=G0QJW6_ICHMU|nr:hypothetical protein IMG5_009800 [Ichthyophthirius multifiliis]EGR34494.1 hypothetical protein IMG5_009800 [Ichthyophthirius multifiliis]|eukprot:XP_004039798.1 hypothetical protein IMG5_009800 [Ichthyophthirius multifiliis]